jgi:hypothetical protein
MVQVLGTEFNYVILRKNQATPIASKVISSLDGCILMFLCMEDQQGYKWL